MEIHIKPEIKVLSDKIISIRRDIHQHPELAFNEHRTAKLVAERLESLGMDVQTGVGKTGVVGSLKGKGKGNRGKRKECRTRPYVKLNKGQWAGGRER